MTEAQKDEALADAREVIEAIEGRGMICFNCEVAETDPEANEFGLCRVHQYTRAWILKYPREK